MSQLRRSRKDDANTRSVDLAIGERADHRDRFLLFLGAFGDGNNEVVNFLVRVLELHHSLQKRFDVRGSDIHDRVIAQRQSFENLLKLLTAKFLDIEA